MGLLVQLRAGDAGAVNFIFLGYNFCPYFFKEVDRHNFRERQRMIPPLAG